MKKLIIAATALLLAIASAAQSKDSVKVYNMGETIGVDSAKVSHRSFPKRLVMPKGAMGVSLQASWMKFNTSNAQALALMTGFNGGIDFFRIAPSFSWAYANNNALGLRIGYSRTNMNVDSGTIRVFSDDLKFELSGLNAGMDTFGAQIFNRSWFGLDQHGRFALFADVALGYSYSSIISPAKSKAANNKIALTFSPGIEIFVINNLSLFFSLNFAQLSYDMAKSYTWTSATAQGGDGTWTQSGDANSFKAQIMLNVIDFNFGLAFYF